MAERQETSVMVSIQEILRDAQSREEQEKVELDARARAETEAKARLAEMNARQEHERHLHALTHDKSKKNLKFLLAGLGVVLFAAAIGGGIVIKQAMDKTAAAVASANELRAQIDEAAAKRQELENQLNAAAAAGEDTDKLK